MCSLIRINGQKNNIYYVEVFPNETIEDVKISLWKKYNKEMSNFTIDDKPIDNDATISELANSKGNQILTFNVNEQQTDQKNVTTNDNSSKQANDKKLDPKIENLLELFQYKIGLSVPKDKIIEALRGDFKEALGTDPDNRVRIKAVEYLIQTENSYSSTRDINSYQTKYQKDLKKIQKKYKELPFCIIAYVFDGNGNDKDKTTKNLKEFLSKKSKN